MFKKFHCCLKTFLSFSPLSHPSRIAANNSPSSRVCCELFTVRSQNRKKVRRGRQTLTLIDACRWKLFTTEPIVWDWHSHRNQPTKKPMNLVNESVTWWKYSMRALRLLQRQSRGQWNLRNWKNLRLRQNAATRSIIEEKNSIKLPFLALSTASWFT
jgi:hypothetical protein